MKYFLLTGLLIGIFACTTPQPITHINEQYHLTGGVEEPTYPPDGPINCWVQPPHDKYWYPCPQKSDTELGQHGH